MAVGLAAPLLIAPHPLPIEGDDTGSAVEQLSGGTGPRQTGVDLTRSVRPYTPGDSARRVHWPATAHHGELMVRETEAQPQSLGTVVVSSDRAGDPAEAAFGRAAAASAASLERDGRVRLVTLERPPGTAPPPIPRAVLLPNSTTVATGAKPARNLSDVPVGDQVVDRIETSLGGLGERLAAAVPGPIAPVDVVGPALWITDRGDERR